MPIILCGDDMTYLCAQVISDLERSIGRYKEEYAVLIADVQAIKSDLASVEKKVGVNCSFIHFSVIGLLFLYFM